jgi:hypothetical protein
VTVSAFMRTLQAILLAVVLAISAPVDAKGSGSYHGGGHPGGSHSSGGHHVSSSSAKVHAGTHGSRSATGTYRNSSSRATTAHSSRAATGVPRDSSGRIKRDPHQRAAFMKSNPCPSTGRRSGGCPGYVVDHVQPLKRGGADRPGNMQWQTKAAAKEKDKRE